LEDYIIATTNPQDTVLVWHVHVGINFTTDRKVPQRVLFPALLFIPIQDAKCNLEEFIDQLENTRTQLLIIPKRSSVFLPFVNVPVEEMCSEDPCIPELAAAIQIPETVEGLQALRDYFLTYYKYDNQIDEWLIYRRLPDE
jgi:hypothetical protein